jgi:hypothetical protein
MPKPNPHSRSTSDHVHGNTRAVPLAVYRELAAELQATQTLLDSLHEQNQKLSQDNQQLSQENQQLKLEIVKVVTSVQHMGNVAQSFDLGDRIFNANVLTPNGLVDSQFPSPRAVTEQPANPNPFEIVKEEASEKKWFLVVVLAIVIGAFGVGYFLARPLISGR